MRNGLILAVMTMLGGCATTVAPKPIAAAPFLSATLRDAAGGSHGTATIVAGRLTIDAAGFSPGAHGLHVHEVGACEGPDFKTAGAHWNPAMRQHGRDNPMGMHSGDLPNILIGTDGRGSLSVDLPTGAAPMMDSDGASVIVHAAADDFKPDPSGNSGARVACGVFGAN